ncbi:MAG: BMP family ABC transporter substrate-binding protein [Bacteroidales bacterium]|nr:BMP family ABC transporter substrate-binding protein [Bacteroidales bacterium]
MKLIRLLPALSMILLSCSDSNSVESVQDGKVIIVMFSPNGLGDRSYSDQLLSGVQRFYSQWADKGVSVLSYNPGDITEAESIFSDWLNMDIGKPSLFAFASSDYVDMANKYLAGTDGPGPDKTVLLYEDTNPNGLPLNSFFISMYGAAYLAGVNAAVCSEKGALVMLGSGTAAPVLSGCYGFVDGWHALRDDDPTVLALANDWSGYSMASDVYKWMYDWADEYDFLFPVAGGSSQGVYRYLREFPGQMWTTGMDIDQSDYCDAIIGSVVKNIDVMTVDCFTAWVEGRELPHGEVYGIESAYIEWRLSPAYANQFQDLIDAHFADAVAKEAEYEGL